MPLMPNGLVITATNADSKNRGKPASLITICIVQGVAIPNPPGFFQTNFTAQFASHEGLISLIEIDLFWVMATIFSLIKITSPAFRYGSTYFLIKSLKL